MAHYDRGAAAGSGPRPSAITAASSIYYPDPDWGCSWSRPMWTRRPGPEAMLVDDAQDDRSGCLDDDAARMVHGWPAGALVAERQPAFEMWLATRPWAERIRDHR
ncbi:hypothetical protein ACRAWD_03575 [Caulobacter segnis]